MLRRQRAVGLLLAPYLLLTLQASAQDSAGINVSQSVLTQHNDRARTGAYLAETALKPSNVNEQNFGLLYTLEGKDTPDGKDLIGPIVAQPLFAKGVTIGGQTKDVLYVASRTNKIYAFDVSFTSSHSALWHIELPEVPQILDLEPITAVWRESDVNKHLDLFATGKDGAVLSNFWDMNDQDWHDWFAIRPATGKTKPGTPQQITAVWGDPNNPQHLNLFMTDQNGRVKSIFCTLRPDHPCWRDESWFAVDGPDGGPGQPIATPGQPVTAIWNQDTTHLDLFVAGRDGQVLSNFFENGKWHGWFAIRPDTGKTKPGTPQQITAVRGDPHNPQHLNLFMTDQNGRVKSIFCTLRPDYPCWRDEAWFAVDGPNGGPGQPIATPGQPVTAIWNKDTTHLDLFIAGRDGRVLSNFFENDKWNGWFAIRPPVKPDKPGTAQTKPGTPQQITAVWGDPDNPQHLNLFMTDHNGTVKSIFCTIQPDHPCWRDRIEVWFTVGQENGIEKMVTAGQPISAVWRSDDSTDFSHLDLFAAGRQETGKYRDPVTGKIKPIPAQDRVIKPIPGQDPVERHGTVLSNFWGTFEGPERDWGTWFPVPLRAEAIPGMDDWGDPGKPEAFPCSQTHGLVGIVSTPVIDPATNTMFVVYRTGLPLDLQLAHHVPDNKQYRADAHHWLAAIDIRNGRLIRPPVKISGKTSAANFVSSMQLNRPALLLDGTGTIYVAFGAAMCDSGGNPYRGEGPLPPPNKPDDTEGPPPHGWVFAYDAKTFNQKGVFTTANGGSDDANRRIIAGIWQSGNGLASDSQGNVYAFTGNNNFPCGGKDQPKCPSPDYSESIIRLKLPGGQITTPFDQPKTFQVPQAAMLDVAGNDGDLAAGGPVLPFDDVLIGGGKQGVLYSMHIPHNPADPWPLAVDAFQAFYNTWPNASSPPIPPPPPECNEITASTIRNDYAKQADGPNIHGSPVVFKPAGPDFAYIYAMPEKDYLRAFKVFPSGRVEHCPAMTTKSAGADNDLRSPHGMPGGFLSISANKDRDGIVWASVTCFKNSQGEICGDASTTSGAMTGRLLAFEACTFDACTLKKLWEDPTDDGPHALPFAKFVPPTVAAGLVFRAEYKDKIHVYGLKTAGPPPVSQRTMIYTQVTSADDLGKFSELKTLLGSEEFDVRPVQVMHFRIGKNQIRYCNAANLDNAEKLRKLLRLRMGDFAIKQIGKCDKYKNMNILEVWLRSGKY